MDKAPMLDFYHKNNSIYSNFYTVKFILHTKVFLLIRLFKLRIVQKNIRVNNSTKLEQKTVKTRILVTKARATAVVRKTLISTEV